MPGLDGTGPAGPRGFGRGGMGAGRGMGMGRGMGRGRCFQGAGFSAGGAVAANDRAALEARLAALEGGAKEIKKLLSEKTEKKK